MYVQVNMQLLMRLIYLNHLSYLPALNYHEQRMRAAHKRQHLAASA